MNASEKLTLVDHFTGFLLSVFVDGGLVDVSWTPAPVIHHDKRTDRSPSSTCRP